MFYSMHCPMTHAMPSRAPINFPACPAYPGVELNEESGAMVFGNRVLTGKRPAACDKMETGSSVIIRPLIATPAAEPRRMFCCRQQVRGPNLLPGLSSMGVGSNWTRPLRGSPSVLRIRTRRLDASPKRVSPAPAIAPRKNKGHFAHLCGPFHFH